MNEELLVRGAAFLDKGFFSNDDVTRVLLRTDKRTVTVAHTECPPNCFAENVLATHILLAELYEVPMERVQKFVCCYGVNSFPSICLQ